MLVGDNEKEIWSLWSHEQASQLFRREMQGFQVSFSVQQPFGGHRVGCLD